MDFAKRMKMYFDLYLCSDDNFGILFKFGSLLFLLSPAFTLTIFLYKFVLVMANLFDCILWRDFLFNRSTTYDGFIG